ncbi:MAG TPA: DUF4266 domain-containing protein [Kofleriaceae bacterium]|nr:DUF4266 domain-containing protein [Kofleriaceae bacterium]
MRAAALTAAAALLAAGAAPRSARAFPAGSQFDLDALTDNGAGGVAFTGAPRFAGHTCSVCHTDPAGQVGVHLGADPADLFDRGYAPGETYHLQVTITGAHAAASRTAAGDDCGFDVTPYSRCDDNGFALEIDDARGEPIGGFAPRVNGACAANDPTAPVRVLDDHSAVTHSGTHHGVLSWDLCWTAPPADTGALTAYVAVVDGNGGDGTEDNPNDVTGDDTFAGAVALRERGGAAPRSDSGGCDARGTTGAGVALVPLILVLAFALGRRRARLGRRRRTAALATIAALATGCVHVKPFQREELAKRKMLFAPDPREDELDLHMQESREGSAGGYGSAGGGCGCN